MRSIPVNVYRVVIAFTLGLVALHVGCSEGNASPDATPASAEKAEVAVFPVPEGTPEELFEFLESLRTKEPPARDPESMKAFGVKLGQTVVAASDKILAAKPSEKLESEALRYKLAGLALLEQTGDSSIAAKREAMRAEYQAAGRDSLARIVEVDQFETRFDQLGRSTREEIATFADDLAKFFEKARPEPYEVDLAMRVARTLEGVLELEQIAQAYERYGKVFVGLEHEQVSAMGSTMIGVARRLQLLGKEMPLEGLTVDGKELDWKKYGGKVVLVQFWATWCGPCLEEIGNIRANYAEYHDRGFEVVAISVDEDRSALVSFLKSNELPWTVLVDEDLRKVDREMMSQRYGIVQYPTTFLVGKNGKAIAFDPFGPALGEELAKLLGKTAPAADPAEVSGDVPAKEADGSKPESS